jgi:lycopene cyclase domain-containing protein
MGQWTYAALLAGCLVVTAPLELVLRVRVYARWRRFLLAVLPEFVVFVAWVLYAIAQGHWDYSDERTLGVRLPGGIPVEELLFFLVVPLCAVLALEAVRRVTGWNAGYPAEEADRLVTRPSRCRRSSACSWWTWPSTAPAWSPARSSGWPTRS